MAKARAVKRMHKCVECDKFMAPGGTTYHRKHTGHTILSPKQLKEQGINIPTYLPSGREQAAKPQFLPSTSTAGRFQCQDCDKSYDKYQSAYAHARDNKHRMSGIEVKSASRVRTPEPTSTRCTCVDCGGTFAIGGSAHAHRIATGHTVLNPKKYAAYLLEKGNQNGNTSGRTITIAPVAQPQGPSDAHIAYICGRFQAEIESYSQSIGVPQSAIAVRVAEFLSLSSRRGLLGAINRMPNL
jgi:hypothetical protein